MKPRMPGIFVLFALMAISACNILPKPSAVHDLGYPYSQLPTETAALTQQSPVTVVAPKWLSDDHLRYRLLYATPTQVRFYALDRWIAPPPELFEHLLNNSAKQWPMPVNIKLHIFEQQFASAQQAKVVMHFTATTVPNGNKQPARQHEFHLQQPCPTADAKGAVTGFNALTKQAVDKVQAWVVGNN